MWTHVKRTVSRCFASLCQLRQIHHSVPTATVQMLVVALVHSRLDYACAYSSQHSLWHGEFGKISCWSACQLTCHVSSSRSWTQSPVMVYHLKARDHITDALISLHWLRTPEWILYKTAVLTYKALHGGAPRYLSSLVHVVDVPGQRALRSVRSNRLQIPPFKLSTIGGRAFPVAAAQFWNRLPDNVTSANSLSAFRQQLKHALFQQSFPDIILWHFLTVTPIVVLAVASLLRPL